MWVKAKEREKNKEKHVNGVMFLTIPDRVLLCPTCPLWEREFKRMHFASYSLAEDISVPLGLGLISVTVDYPID
jgi:hypothetical protein